jgi:hypothetical protein
MTSFDAPPPPGRRCSCKDIDDLIDQMFGGAASATHYRDTERDLTTREGQNLPRPASQAEWLAAEAAFRIPPRDKGAGGSISSTTQAAAVTDGGTCRSEIPTRSLTRSCDGIIRSMWEHERVHRDSCKARVQAGKTAVDYNGSYHAAEEAAAYEAGNAILRTEIERVLEDSWLTVRASVTGSAESPNSHQDSNFTVRLDPQGASNDGVVEFVDLSGKGETRFTKLRHDAWKASPVSQILTLSVRTVDMQNFTVIYKPGAPKTVPFTGPGRKWSGPLVPMFNERWSQPIRAQRPFPFSASVVSNLQSLPMPPGMSLPTIAQLMPPGFSMPNLNQLPPGALLQLPDLTPNMPGKWDTMLTLSCR